MRFLAEVGVLPYLELISAGITVDKIVSIGLMQFDELLRAWLLIAMLSYFRRVITTMGCRIKYLGLGFQQLKEFFR